MTVQVFLALLIDTAACSFQSGRCMSLVGLILASLTYLHLLSRHGRMDALPVAIIIICWSQIISTCQASPARCKHECTLQHYL